MKSLKSKFIVVLILFVGIGVFMSCEKEEAIIPSQNVQQQDIDYTENVKEIVLQDKEVNALFLEMGKFINFAQMIDKSLVEDYESGKITNEELYASMPDNMKAEYDDIYNSYKVKIQKIEKNNTINNINWEKSFYQGDISILNKSMDVRIACYKDKDCDSQYALATAGNFVEFAVSMTGCGLLVEIPPLAAGCVYVATSNFYDNQTQTVNDYNNCIRS